MKTDPVIESLPVELLNRHSPYQGYVGRAFYEQVLPGITASLFRVAQDYTLRCRTAGPE